jgi:hypothetical protein
MNPLQQTELPLSTGLYLGQYIGMKPDLSAEEAQSGASEEEEPQIINGLTMNPDLALAYQQSQGDLFSDAR